MSKTSLFADNMFRCTCNYYMVQQMIIKSVDGVMLMLRLAQHSRSLCATGCYAFGILDPDGIKKRSASLIYKLKIFIKFCKQHTSRIKVGTRLSRFLNNESVNIFRELKCNSAEMIDYMYGITPAIHQKKKRFALTP